MIHMSGSVVQHVTRLYRKKDENTANRRILREVNCSLHNIWQLQIVLWYLHSESQHQRSEAVIVTHQRQVVSMYKQWRHIGKLATRFKTAKPTDITCRDSSTMLLTSLQQAFLFKPQPLYLTQGRQSIYTASWLGFLNFQPSPNHHRHPPSHWMTRLHHSQQKRCCLFCWTRDPYPLATPPLLCRHHPPLYKG